ncbi:MAG: hypothetical protein WBF71_12345 [Microthrixaceae bacterium]
MTRTRAPPPGVTQTSPLASTAPDEIGVANANAGTPAASALSTPRGMSTAARLQCMPALNPIDEQRHVPDDSMLWNESYYMDWFSEDQALGGYVRIGFYPSMDRVWYWACLVGPDRSLITVIEHDVPMPRDAASLGVRHSGIWADHTIEVPGEHMSINLESFGLRLDSPSDVYHDPRGEQIPFGFELDFFTDQDAYMWPPVTPRYEIPCRVHGRVLVGAETIEFDGWGQRDHSWGATRDWWTNTWCWSAGRLDDGTRFHATGGFFPDDDYGIAYELEPGGSFREFDQVAITTELGDEGLPTIGRQVFGDLDLSFEPLAFSPVLLVHPDGRESRFPRALARVTAADGRTGTGWIEWNQPPPPSNASDS